MSTIKSYAAKEAGADLSLWEYDAGDLKPEDVEVQVEYCGICHSDLSMIDNEWGMSSYPLVVRSRGDWYGWRRWAARRRIKG